MISAQNAGAPAFSITCPAGSLLASLTSSGTPTCLAVYSANTLGAANISQASAQSSTALCTATASTCGTTGQYSVNWNFQQIGTACTSIVAGTVAFVLSWTDANGTAHSLSAPMVGEGSAAGTPLLSQNFYFQTNLANAWSSGQLTILTNGTAINYSTTYTACTIGTGTYQLAATVQRIW